MIANTRNRFEKIAEMSGWNPLRAIYDPPMEGKLRPSVGGVHSPQRSVWQYDPKRSRNFYVGKPEIAERTGLGSAATPESRRAAIENVRAKVEAHTGGREAPVSKGFGPKSIQPERMEINLEMPEALKSMKSAIGKKITENPRAAKAIGGVLGGVGMFLGGRAAAGKLKSMLIKNYLRRNSAPLVATAAGSALAVHEITK